MDTPESRIVIAEDSAVQAEALRRILVAKGYAVSVAKDGVEGLALVNEIRPALVISDIIMPNLNGFEFCRRIKDDPELGATPVILLTSLADPADVISGLECGADNFIVKPYDERQLLSRIRHIQLNRELRQDERTQMGVQISFAGKNYFITSEKKQILDLLISTYESAVQKNIALATVQEELEQLNEQLEQRVEARTAELSQEIAERKRMEEELKKSEKFIKDILASVDEAFVVVDREFRILTANRAYCEQTGKVLEEVIGRYCYEISHQATEPCREPEWVCGCRRTIATGEPSVVTHTHTDAAGRQRQVEIKTFAMKDGAGEITSFIEVINDITEHNRLEAQLRQAQKMEAIGTLAGGIAHDFNNILTAILGYGEIAMDKVDKKDPLREDIGQILRAGARARDLVKQILTFSRRSEQQQQPLLIQFIIKEALKLLRASIPSSIEIREDIDTDCGLVLADPVQIHQVVMNLCTNAYQAMRETGGVLKVTLKSVPLPEEIAKKTANLCPGQHLRLEVADTGCGMTRVVRERIFEPYFTTKAKGEGTGLGLSLVHGIVTGLGGGINVYSEPGLGTTFKVYLPLIAGEICGEQAIDHLAPPGGDDSIMVVDDEEVIARLEEKILAGLGYRVTVFDDSEKALEAFRNNPQGFDLILTDMTMPRLNGDELAREILKVRTGMPVILCTGYSELIDAEKAKALGARGYLLKPLEKGELARAVRRALDGGYCENA